MPAADRTTVANLKARLRMTTLYAFANHLGYRVVGTGNASELAVGYFTKYGDGGVDLLPLGSLTKTAVRALARHLGVPERIVERAPSAGLWPGQTDEGDLGFTYDELDAYPRRRARPSRRRDRPARRGERPQARPGAARAATRERLAATHGSPVETKSPAVDRAPAWHDRPSFR